MTPVYRYSIRCPRRVVAVAILVTLAVAPGVTRLRLRTDGNALLPRDAREIQLDRSIRDEFGVLDQIAVVIKSDDPHGIFNLHTLDLVRKWTGRFGEIEGIDPEDVVSLATESSDRVVTGSLRNRRFLEPPPKTRQDLDRVRDDLKRIQLYTGTLVSYDDRATAILIGVPDGVDRPRLHQTLQSIVAEQGDIPETVHIVGAPVAESLLGTHILEDLGVPSALMGRHIPGGDEAGRWRFPRSVYELRLFVARHIGLVPVAVIIMALVFLVSFRSLAAAMLPLGEVGACLVFVFGLMGWCSVPIYLTIAVLPVILTAMGVADEIHIFSHYRQHLRKDSRGPGFEDSRIQGSLPPQITRILESSTPQILESSNRRILVGRTMDEMWRPVVKTSVTTAVGFMSFVLSPIAPVRAFGIFTAVGIIFCMLWSLTVIPACLVLLNPRHFKGTHPRSETADRRERAGLLHGFATAVVRYRYVAILAGLLVLVAAPFGVRRAFVQDSWIDGFAPNSEFYQATQMVNRSFHGTHILLVCVNTDDEELHGEVMSGNVEHFGAKLPVDQQIDLKTLIGRWLRISPPDAPDVGGGAEGVKDSRIRGFEHSSIRRGKRPRHPRMARIDGADRQGELVAFRTNRNDGSLRPVPHRGPDELYTYEIRPRAFLFPETVRLVEGLEGFIESHREDAVGGVIGTADYISTINYMASGQKEVWRCIPDAPHRIRWLWQQYKRVRGDRRLSEIMNPEHSRALITVFMEDANYIATRHLMEDIRQYERTYLAPHGISLEFAGDVAVSQALIGAIVTTQVRSLLLSLLGILAITVLMGRSIGWGIYCVLPCALAVLVNFAVMGLLEMPLGVATSMFSAMTLGIGVDYAIHLTERFRYAMADGLPSNEAAIAAVKTAGPPIILDAMAIALGFGVMVLSQVPSNARLGALVVLSVVNCLLATLVLLPALLTVWQPKALGCPGRSRPRNPGR
ncbi:MAG: MMPL family transporter [Phycisphaerae bacterium]|nr:MMPL family transporter [Phycisphaerae bacterium]